MEAVQKSTMVWSSGLSTICRLCMQNDGFLLAIFNHHHQSIGTSENRSIQRKIAEFTTLELSSGDGLPPCVCHRCLYKVELCLEFRQQCLLSDSYLRQHKPREYNNGENISDQDSEEFRNYDIPPDQSIEDVVMVVDPNMDYDSENESDFEQHNQSDTENVPENFKNVFMCKYCDKAYTNKEEHRVHETTAHNFEVPFQCATCQMDFGDRTIYTAHLKSVHSNDKPFKCPDCERSFSRRSDLRKHTVVHTGIKPFTCHICFKSFSRNTNLTKHIRIHTGSKPYVCPQCPKTFISKGDLSRHAIIHSGQKPFACSYCDQSFGRRDKLLRHEKKHTTSLLSQSQIQMEPLENDGGHWLDTESGIKPEQGDELEKTDDRNERLVDEEEDSWNGQNMVVSVDPFQGQNFDEKSDSQLISEENRALPPVPEHITADSDYTIKRYPCLVCHQRFLTSEEFRSHIQTHNTVDVYRPHVCLLCNKSFLRKRELDRHIAIHTGMKPFKCTSCNKKFGRKDKLVRHMRIHDPGRNLLHSCTVCGVSFARKDSLTQHMKNHNSTEDLSQS